MSGTYRVKQELQNPERLYAYCFSAEQRLSQKKHGEYLVTIIDPKELIKRITSSIITRYHMSWGEIQYYDPDESMQRAIFDNVLQRNNPFWLMKRRIFEDEREFRIVLARGDVDHLWDNRKSGAQNLQDRTEWERNLTIKVCVGDIQDIASMSTEDI